MIIVQIAGRLGRDAETRFTASGQKVTSLTVATNVRKAGKEETVWWRVTMWGERFDKMIPYLKKGSAVVAVGEMSKPDIWADKEGRQNVGLEMTAEIVRFNPFGNPDKQENNAAGNQQYSSSNKSAEPSFNKGSDSGFGDFSMQGHSPSGLSSDAHDDDSIPF